MKKVTAILTADLHLRDTVPIARTDDFMSAQKRKLEFIKQLSILHKCIVLIAGDIFDKAKSSPYIQAMTLSNFPERAIGIPGNHCLPFHSLKNYENSSFHVLEAAGAIKTLLDNKEELILEEEGLRITGFPFGVKFQDSPEPFEGRKISLVHDMVVKDKKIHESIESKKAISMLKNTSYDLIVTGDNHTPFTEEHEGRLLVNCGSMMRTTAAQGDYKPAVWLWYAEDNTVEKVYLPIEKDVISRDHLDFKELRNARMDAFIESADKDYDVSSSFEKNLNSYYGKNKTRKGVKSLISESLGD